MVQEHTQVIPSADWQQQAARHLQRVGPYADAFVQRRSRGGKHPVHDFLFTYYPFSPSKLRQWVPALGQSLEMNEAVKETHPWLFQLPVLVDDKTLQLDPAHISAPAARAAAFIRQLCTAILERSPRFSCFGLHEWAMVYQQPAEQVRHQGYELRMSPRDLAAFVDAQAITCTHFDAFRFFTPEARPLNTLQPTLDTRMQNEQSGCLHANMDLYKWATKLWPWCGSDLVADAFLLAMEGRDLDMRASPYDLRHMGYEPILIETPAGRERYRTEQQALQEKSAPLRERLRAAAESILHHAPHQ